MTNEKIEKRIKEFHFWMWVNWWFILWTLILTYAVFVDMPEIKLSFTIANYFFVAMFWVCKWFEDLYTDMKE